MTSFHLNKNQFFSKKQMFKITIILNSLSLAIDKFVVSSCLHNPCKSLRTNCIRNARNNLSHLETWKSRGNSTSLRTCS